MALNPLPEIDDILGSAQDARAPLPDVDDLLGQPAAPAPAPPDAPPRAAPAAPPAGPNLEDYIYGTAAAPERAPAAGSSPEDLKNYEPAGIKPELEKLPDWMMMPELWSVSKPQMAALLGTLGTTTPEETAKIIEKQLGVKSRPEGRYQVFTSSDGSEYAWKPGLRTSDVVRGLGAGALAAGATAAGAAAASAVLPAAMTGSVLAPIVGGAVGGLGTEAGMQAIQAATGGKFDTADVLLSGAFGGAVPALGAAARGVKAVVGGETAEATARAAGQAFDDTAGALGRASQSGGKAIDELAERMDLDREALAAAERRGLPVRPDQVSNDPAFRSVARSAAPAVDDTPLVESIRSNLEQAGAQLDKGVFEVSTKNATQSSLKDLATKSRVANTEVRDAIGRATEVDASQPLAFLDGYVKDLNGAKPPKIVRDALEVLRPGSKGSGSLATLAGDEKKLFDDLLKAKSSEAVNPLYKTKDQELAGIVEGFVQRRAYESGARGNLLGVSGGARERLVDRGAALMDEARKRGNEILESAVAGRTPTAAPSGPTLLAFDSFRKEVGRATKGKGKYASSEPGLAGAILKELEGAFATTAERFGVGEKLVQAKELSKQSIAANQAINTLFGRQLDRILDGTGSAISSAVRGDTSNLFKLLDVVPKEQQSDFVVSVLGRALEKADDLPKFVNLWGAMDANSQIKNLMMTSMSPETRSVIKDLVTAARVAVRAAGSKPDAARLKAALPNPKLKAAGKFLGAIVTDAGLFSFTGIPSTTLSTVAGLALKDAETDGVKIAARFLAENSGALLAAASKPRPPDGLLKGIMKTPSFQRFANAARVPPGLRQRWLEQTIANAAQSARDASSGPSAVRVMNADETRAFNEETGVRAMDAAQTRAYNERSKERN